MHILFVKNTYTVTKAQAKFLQLARFEDSDFFTITRHDEPVAAIIKWDRLEGIMETLDLMADPEAVKHIRAARAGKGGKGVSLDELERKLEGGRAR